MGSRPNPKTWIPYVNPRDCSQGFCTLYCPQWCYIIFPPPPPFAFPDDDDSSPSISPLVIALIGILASAFLLVSYYAMMSKYCRNRGSTNRRQNHVHSLEFEENQDPSVHVYWDVPTNGLDESLIKSITMFKYKKGDGLIEGTDCSVCLSEFEEDESLRLLPKCSHAFHVTCIDTWLKSHSNCPLCRANIGSPRELPPPVMETRPGDEELTQTTPEDDNSAVVDDIEIGVRQQEIAQNVAATTPESAPGDEQNSEIRSTLINIRTDEDQRVIRRSLSMDSPCQGRVSIADILRTSDGEDYQPEKCRFHFDAGCSKGQAAEMSRSSNRNSVLHCVTRPVVMKRSFSSGRFSFSNRGRGRNSIILSDNFLCSFKGNIRVQQRELFTNS